MAHLEDPLNQEEDEEAVSLAVAVAWAEEDVVAEVGVCPLEALEIPTLTICNPLVVDTSVDCS